MSGLRGVIRRYRWSLLIIITAVLAWYPAYEYLIDFRSPDVPFVTTPDDVVAAMLDLAEVRETDKLYDLGSGDGRIVLAAARDRGARAHGYELDPELVRQSRALIAAAGLSERATVSRGDIFKSDFDDATVITMYLLPQVNTRLRPQLDRLKPGTRIVSHMFSMPGAKPVRKIEVKSNISNLDHTLYLWVTPIEWDSE